MQAPQTPDSKLLQDMYAAAENAAARFDAGTDVFTEAEKFKKVSWTTEKTKAPSTPSRHQRRVAEARAKQAAKRAVADKQLHLFLTQPEVRMLNAITHTLGTDPRDFLKSVIPFHYKQVMELADKARAEMDDDAQSPDAQAEFDAGIAAQAETMNALVTGGDDVVET